MGRRILDPKLMTKVATKLHKRKLTDINVMVSRRASKLGISPEAALILIAKENGIGTSTFQRRLDSAKQTEVRVSLPSLLNVGATVSRGKEAARSASRPTKSSSPRKNLRVAIEYLIQDEELLDRCQDILMARSNFDRPINQATLVLEDRIRNKAKLEKRLVGENLVNAAFKENMADTVLQIASGDPEDQRGYLYIMRGIVPAFRNKTHHHVINKFSREDAMRVCGFIDVLLRVVDGSVKIK